MQIKISTAKDRWLEVVHMVIVVISVCAWFSVFVHGYCGYWWCTIIKVGGIKVYQMFLLTVYDA